MKNSRELDNLVERWHNDNDIDIRIQEFLEMEDSEHNDWILEGLTFEREKERKLIEMEST